METSFRKVNSEIGTSNLSIQFYEPISRPASPPARVTHGQPAGHPASKALHQPAIQPASQPASWYCSAPRSNSFFFFPAFLLFRFLFAFRFGAWLHMRTAATSIGQRTMNINCIHLRTFLRLYVFGGGWVWGGGEVGGGVGWGGELEGWRGGVGGWGWWGVG